MDSILDRMARAGFLARGAIYLCIGGLAAMAAAGMGGRATDASGAVRTMGRAGPQGLVLALLALGLFGYGTWRLASGLFDLDREGRGAKAVGVRAVAIVSGLAHLGLAFTAAGFGLQSLGVGGQGSAGIRRSVAGVLAQPAGAWLVGATGLAILATGVYQFYRAYTVKFEEHVDRSEMSSAMRTWYRRLGRFGTAARGVTFIVIGLALVRAARQVDAGQAKGLADALRELQSHPHGELWMGVVAAGLAAYGLTSLMEARFRRMVS